MTPPGSEPQMQPQRINFTLKPQMPQGTAPTAYPGHGMIPAMKGQGGNGSAGVGGVPSAYYASAPFHSHIEQLGKLTRPFSSYVVQGLISWV